MATAKNEVKLLFSGWYEPLVKGIKIWWGESAGRDFSWCVMDE